MARRRDSGLVVELARLLASLPWWVGVLAAGLTYGVFHAASTTALPAAIDTRQMDSIVLRGVLVNVAYGLQFVIPLICLVGATASALKRRSRKAAFAMLANRRSVDALNDMSWSRFEAMVGEGFRGRGFSVVETGGGGPDGGVDLVLRKNGDKYLVQCKQWRALSVGVEVVRELYGVMAATGAAGGFVVTSGRFTSAAMRFADGRNVVLVDGPQLCAMIETVGAPHAVSGQVPNGTADVSTPTDPSCPQCSSPMVRRTAKRGTRSGQAFWGCTAYRACRGVRPIERRAA
jgi:restriction system protein